jgi:hypothetical protein
MSAGMLAETPDPSMFKLRGMTHNGSGCPSGSIATYISPDVQVFTISFDAYSAQHGAGVSPSESRKGCDVEFDFQVPAGWQFSLSSVEYRGYANLDAGLKGTIMSQYRFAGGGAAQRPFRMQLDGPVSEDYVKRDVLEARGFGWSVCGARRGLSIRSDVRIFGNRNQSGLLTVDTIDGEFKQTYRLNWRRCR